MKSGRRQNQDANSTSVAEVPRWTGTRRSAKARKIGGKGGIKMGRTEEIGVLETLRPNEQHLQSPSCHLCPPRKIGSNQALPSVFANAPSAIDRDRKETVSAIAIIQTDRVNPNWFTKIEAGLHQRKIRWRFSSPHLYARPPSTDQVDASTSSRSPLTRFRRPKTLAKTGECTERKTAT